MMITSLLFLSSISKLFILSCFCIFLLGAVFIVCLVVNCRLVSNFLHIYFLGFIFPFFITLDIAHLLLQFCNLKLLTQFLDFSNYLTCVGDDCTGYNGTLSSFSIFFCSELLCQILLLLLLVC